MLMTVQQFALNTYIVKNNNSSELLEKISKQYNLKIEDIKSILNAFDIDFEENKELEMIDNLLNEGKSILEISNKLQIDRFNLKSLINKSPQLCRKFKLMEYYDSIENKFGKDILNEIKKINLDPILIVSGSLPKELFQTKSYQSLVNLGISEPVIKRYFRRLNREEDIVFYNIPSTIKSSRDRVGDLPEIRKKYEEDSKCTLVSLSKEFDIPILKLTYVKNKFKWIKARKNYADSLSTKINKWYNQDGKDIFFISKKLKLSILNSMKVMSNYVDLHLDDIIVLFKDVNLSIQEISDLYRMPDNVIREKLKIHLGTIPPSYNKYNPDMNIETWSQFQKGFLLSDLSDKELSSFINKPEIIIHYKRKDIDNGILKLKEE